MLSDATSDPNDAAAVAAYAHRAFAHCTDSQNHSALSRHIDDPSIAYVMIREHFAGDFVSGDRYWRPVNICIDLQLAQ